MTISTVHRFLKLSGWQITSRLFQRRVTGRVGISNSRNRLRLSLLIGIPLLSLLPLTLLVFSASNHGAFVAFGPVDYTRGPGRPDRVTRTFTILNPSIRYTLQIFNGGKNGQFTKINKARIMLNGVRVVSHRDFRHHPSLIEKTVTLSLQDTLVVELRGRPGDDDDGDDDGDDDQDHCRPRAGLTVQIVGVDNDWPNIQATLNPLPNSNGWNNSDVNVAFTCSDATSGIAICQASVIVSTAGANQTVTGKAVDRAGNSATTSVKLNIDKTPPQVTVTSPANGQCSG